MSNHELMKLAAASVGAEYVTYSDGTPAHWVLKDEDGMFEEWDPLEDDGDALRMAMKLGICIQFIHEFNTVCAYQERTTTGEPFNVHVAGLGDIADETRRVITLAAAEIGKAKGESQ